MDDLYQNAWSDTNDPAPAFKSTSTPSWSSPRRLTSSLDEETDLAAPSWSTGTGIPWDEPSTSPGFSWSHAESDAGWGSSTYEGITLSKPSVEAEKTLATVPEDIVTHESVHDVTEHSGTSPTISVPSSPAQLSPSLSSIPPPQSIPTESYEVTPALVAPPSPDGFGSFESGLIEENTPSPSFQVNGADADPWGSSAWADTKLEEEEEEPIDEWERARQQKAKQDRRVPPELLSNILSQCEQLSREIGSVSNGDEQTSEKDGWRNDRRSGIEGVPGLSAFMECFLPPLTLQPPVRFSQALITKKMATSVKLTKNLPLTRGSPMSHYLSAKGSTAWEISVKERKEVVEDDVPMGWRIVEKTPAVSPTDPLKDKKQGSGLFSFWGRRHSQTPSSMSSADSDGRTSTSSDKAKSPVVAEMNTESKRPSQDSMTSSMTGSLRHISSPTNESSSSHSVPGIAPPAMSSYASASDPIPERSGTPSAVSRFLNRFSRRGGSGGSPRSSLALSSDDLEYLSDIVPSASDGPDDDATNALEAFVSSKPQPTIPALLPPPLAPPPKAPPLIPVTVAGKLPSATAKLGSPAMSVANDFDALFGSVDLGNAATPSSVSRPSSIPPLAPPFELPRSLISSSTPGAGPSKPSVVPAVSSRSSSRPPSRMQTSTPPMAGFALPPPPSFKPIVPTIVPMKPSKPKLPSPFSFPPPPSSQIEPGPMSASSTSSRSTSYQTAASSAPPSPTTSLPLSDQYPQLAPSPVSPPQASAQAFLADDTPAGLVQPALGDATPMSSAFPPTPSPPLLRPPVQMQASRSPITVSLTSNLFDDDDFSDFQCPVDQLQPPPPAPIAKSPRTLMNAALRKQPARLQTLPTLSPFALRPPPGSSVVRLNGAAYTAPQADLASFEDDDDFADFQASPLSSDSPQPSSSSTSTLFAKSSSDTALLTPKMSASSFNGLDDFFGSESALTTPSPPRVPAKSAPPQPPLVQIPSRPAVSPPTQTVKSSSSNPSLLNRRRSQAANHLHTLSLVEKAAARQGQQWPAPPSPLPAAIPGPDGPLGKASLFNIMDEEEPVRDIAQTRAPLAPSFSSPALSNPPARVPSRSGAAVGLGGNTNASTSANGASLNGFGSTRPMSPRSTGSTRASSPLAAAQPPEMLGWDALRALQTKTAQDAEATAKVLDTVNKMAKTVQNRGGLSAQDLSFFEGL